MSEFTDSLIRKAQSGDQDAIAELYALTYNSVYKTVKSMIADEDTVLDIVQDSYIKGFQSLDQLDTPENFRAWMKRIATNKAKDYLKKKKPLLFTDMENEDGEELEFRDDRLDHCPEAVVDRKETTRLMNEILATLSEDQRLVIGMFYYEEMSVREIAETLGCSENTVKSRLNYGRKKVEIKVRDLEKKGVKLFSMAPLPFLLWLFRLDAEAAVLPSATVLETITGACAATGVTAGAAAAGTGVKAAAGAGIKALAAKIIAGVLAVSVVGGGAMLALSSGDSREAPPTQQFLPKETASPKETATPAHGESTVPETTDPGDQDIIAAYQKVLAALQSACSVSSRQWLADSAAYHQQYSHLNTAMLDRYHQSGRMQLYYAYADLDGNGIRELIIGEYGLEAHHMINSIYTFDGTGAVEIIESDANRIVDICADGSILVTEGTILNGISYIYGIGADGIYPDIIATHTFDLYADTFQSESETLSSQEYYAKYVPNGSWALEWNYLCG